MKTVSNQKYIYNTDFLFFIFLFSIIIFLSSQFEKIYKIFFSKRIGFIFLLEAFACLSKSN